MSKQITRHDTTNMHYVDMRNRNDRRAIMWMVLAVVAGLIWLLVDELWT